MTGEQTAESSGLSEGIWTGIWQSGAAIETSWFAGTTARQISIEPCAETGAAKDAAFVPADAGSSRLVG